MTHGKPTVKTFFEVAVTLQYALEFLWRAVLLRQSRVEGRVPSDSALFVTQGYGMRDTQPCH